MNIWWIWQRYDEYWNVLYSLPRNSCVLGTVILLVGNTTEMENKYSKFVLWNSGFGYLCWKLIINTNTQCKTGLFHVFYSEIYSVMICCRDILMVFCTCTLLLTANRFTIIEGIYWVFVIVFEILIINQASY